MLIHPPSRIGAILIGMILSVAIGATVDGPSSARLRDGRFNAPIPRAFGGGEVVLELTIDSAGGVADIARVRTTPPYLDYVVDAVAGWRFAPATALTAGTVTPVAAPVLVVAAFRPPLVYAGPAPGARSQVLGAVSRRSPGVASVTQPAYPPMAIGDGIVIVEIEMSRQAEPRGYRIIGAASGFDSAALAAVRTWRFAPPRDADVPEPIFAYAVLGFRAPLTLPAQPRPPLSLSPRFIGAATRAPRSRP